MYEKRPVRKDPCAFAETSVRGAGVDDWDETVDGAGVGGEGTPASLWAF